MTEDIKTIDGLYEQQLTPTEYFNTVKQLKHTITDEELAKAYENCLEMLEKCRITGQHKSAHRLIFHLEAITKERDLVKMGLNQFVYKEDIEYYIKNVASDVVKIIDLESYEREIPDEIVDTIAKTKHLFDQLYIVFTDYTGEAEKKVKKERRDKDPILFGAFKKSTNNVIIDRFYFLGDWVDEYCDLTLDKMVSECERVGKRNIAHTIKTPEDLEEFKKQLGAYNSVNIRTHNLSIDASKPEKKASFFDKVRSIFKK